MRERTYTVHRDGQRHDDSSRLIKFTFLGKNNNLKPKLAGVILLESKGLCLAIKRAEFLNFQPNYWSFPGGGVESSDGHGEPQQRAAQAALRELAEEVGITLPTNALSELRFLGRWQTPAYAGAGFDTYFFALSLAEPPTVAANEEVAAWQWVDLETFRSDWKRAEKMAAIPVIRALEALYAQPAPPFSGGGDRRGFLSMGGPAPYLPLKTLTLPPATHTNCVAILTDQGPYLVDPAPVDDEERQLLVNELAVLESNHGPLQGLILSHLHYDHLGACAWLAHQAGVPVLGTQATAEDLKAGEGAGLSAGGADGGALPTIDRFLSEGDRIGAWEVFETPGHARGHLCLFEPESRVLVCGDMCAGNSTILIEPQQGDMALYLRSLQRLADLKPRLAIPAHGQALADAEQALRQLIAHRLRREEKVLASLATADPPDLETITPIAYADADPRVWPIARLSVHSHLLKLESEGRVQQRAAGWAAVDG